MKLVFMGTPEFAVSSLEALLQDGHQVEAVVTQPDRPRGRGRVLTPPPVKETALQHALPILQPEKVREPEFVEQLRALAPEVIIVVAFGQILPRSILEIPPRGCINVHASLLPRWRGAAPIQYAVIHGDPITGVTTMQMDPGMDTGPMLLKSTTPVEPNETSGELTARLSKMGAQLLLETLRALEAGTVHPTPQDSSQATKAPSLSREDGRVDWSASAQQIHNLVRGSNPAPGAFTMRSGEVLKLWETQVDETGEDSAEPGTIVAMDNCGVSVQAASGRVRLLVVQPESRKRMSAPEWARGYSLRPGDKIG